MFEPLPPVPDHPGLEREIIAWWEERRIFERLREQTKGAPKWSFVDGPITANNPMGVHHGWGRTLKDVFQRFQALQGHELRYQNGFDCQGLWVEVEVEKSLGLNSKREIEEYGLAEFARRCRERVAEFSEVQTRQSIRLGMWMDWANDYYTFSDTNISYIWGFLKSVHEHGWLYQGHRSMTWCPRCGTSLSQHELIDSYRDITHPSLFVRFPLVERPGEALVVWTTTPWTLPANVAAAVRPDAEYVLVRNGGGGEWVAAALRERLPVRGDVVERARGADLAGLRYVGPFDELLGVGAPEHRVIPWDEVSLEEGTGIFHIAPGCGAEDFELSRVHDLAVLAPIDESGRFHPEYGWLHGLTTVEARDQIVFDLGERGRLVDAGELTHRYPVCWRCGTELVFRLVDEWFIAADEIRPQMLAANATVAWTPEFYSKRMDDWLRNMGDWCISRKRYFGLPLPFYPCESCGKLNVVGSEEELRARATAGLEQLEELHRPWVDEVLVSCEHCGAEGLRRLPDVGDAWLDAGIVPFSTLGWQNPEWKPGGYATGASKGLSGADLPDHAQWEKWFPADWVTEMREQIRLWFYSQLFMSVALVGRAPYRQVLTFEKLNDEAGRAMHKSWGNAIELNEALEKMGADVMRWLYASQIPSQNLNFGYGPAGEVKRRLLTFWNTVSFLVTYANIEGFAPRWDDLERGPEADDLRPLDRWVLARTQELVAEATDAFEGFWTPRVVGAFESFVDDLSNWYVRRNRRRFWDGEETAFRVLWYAVVQALRVVSPIMPFLAEHLWGNLVARPYAGAPESVFLAGWPEPVQALVDEPLLREIAEAREYVELGRAARAQAGVKLRQPLPYMMIEGASAISAQSASVPEIEDELRVKKLEFKPLEGTVLRARPNLPLLGPKLGKALPEVRQALSEGKFEVRANGRISVLDYELDPEEVFLERSAPDGWAVVEANGKIVALVTRQDPELELEGRVLDLIHTIQRLRKDSGLEITDRIVVTLPEDGDLMRHEEWIKAETLAVRIERGPELAIAKA